MGLGLLLLSSNHSGGGKDFTAKYLREVIAPVWAHDSSKKFEVTTVSIANDLKLEVSRLFAPYGIMAPSWYDADRNRRKIAYPGLGTVVDLWIKYGEAVRAICPNFWVDRVAKQLRTFSAMCKGNVLVVVPDVRFDNEVDTLRKAYPTLNHWHITSKLGEKLGSDGLLSGRVLTQATHLYNDGTDMFEAAIRDASYFAIRSLLDG